MINIWHFFYLAKVFGLAPYHLQVDVKRNRVAAFVVRIPTFLMMFCYAMLVCSIFWKNKAVSEISNTVNWIQVKLFGAENIFAPRNAENFRPQFVPNSTIFFIVLLTAEGSRRTIESVGTLIQGLDQKLKTLNISFVATSKRVRKASIAATFSNAMPSQFA